MKHLKGLLLVLVAAATISAQEQKVPWFKLRYGFAAVGACAGDLHGPVLGAGLGGMVRPGEVPFLLNLRAGFQAGPFQGRDTATNQGRTLLGDCLVIPKAWVFQEKAAIGLGIRAASVRMTRDGHSEQRVSFRPTVEFLTRLGGERSPEVSLQLYRQVATFADGSSHSGISANLNYFLFF